MQDIEPEYVQQTTLRDYILKGRSYVREVFRYWYVPAFFALVAMGYQVYKYSKYVPVYPARITFMVDEDEGNSSAGLSGMLSQFGLGGMRPVRYNLDKILELSKSRKVVQRSLFTKITIDGKEDYLANHLISIYQLDPVSTEEKSSKETFRFSHDSLPNFTREENMALSTVYGFIIGSKDNPETALVITDYSEETNVMSLSATTINENLSYELSSRMFQSLSDYYISKSIEKSLKTLKIVSMKRDSILGVLRSAEYQLANFEDSNRGLLMRVDQVGRIRLQREVTALSAMYAEVLKNSEVADFSLRNKTPFVQVIDAPILPIQPVEISLIKKLLIGLIIGCVIGSVLIIGRRMYIDLMNDPTPSAYNTA